jgi:hypothetical protein
MPQNKKKLFAKHQEGAKNDVERAFEALQSRFAIVRGPARFWDINKLTNIVTSSLIACTIHFSLEYI